MPNNIEVETQSSLEDALVQVQSKELKSSQSVSKRWQNFVDTALRLFLPDKVVRKFWRFYYRFCWRFFGTLVGSILLTICLQHPAAAQLGQKAEEDIESNFSPYLKGATDFVSVLFSSGRMFIFFLGIGLVCYGIYDGINNRGSSWHIWAGIGGTLVVGIVLVSVIEGAIYGT